MKIKDFVTDIKVINSMGELRTSSENSIVFPNGWVASVLKKEDWHSFNGNYSVAVCDYNGYFDWDILEMFGTVNGAVICNTENEVCEILIIIKNLKSIKGSDYSD